MLVSKDLRQTCYFMASNSLHLTTMCLKYRPTVVAAFCIHISCQWAGWEVSLGKWKFSESGTFMKSTKSF